ncbi:PulJ/GspJ family protein [Heyndrickxia acidiproducens]|jgi:hypothetical protein|uniref:PulJ/GspJ family protein n=1 Tax=Heyndrickxia acidiproducens TaxID=1121084 RepID=UPI00035C264A|nr:prepilin-type N-terminal cleavage/methylation domain-containing protein [Heyndrickxia acidiproducens]
MRVQNERGVTLVELLAAIFISFLIIGGIYAVFINLVKQSEADLSKKNLVIEQTAILKNMNRAMENVDQVEVSGDEDANGTFTSFIAIDHKMVEQNGGRSYTTKKTSIPITTTNGNLSIDGMIINSDHVSLDHTAFKLDKDILQCHFVIKDKKHDQIKKLFVSYQLSGRSPDEGD